MNMNMNTHTRIRGERQREEKEMCCTWRSWSHNIVNMHAYMWKGDHPSGISWDTGHVHVCARVRERDNHDNASSLHVKLAGEGARSRAAWYNRGEACRYEWVSRGCVCQWGVGGTWAWRKGEERNGRRCHREGNDNWPFSLGQHQPTCCRWSRYLTRVSSPGSPPPPPSENRRRERWWLNRRAKTPQG